MRTAYAFVYRLRRSDHRGFGFSTIADQVKSPWSNKQLEGHAWLRTERGHWDFIAKTLGRPKSCLCRPEVVHLGAG